MLRDGTALAVTDTFANFREVGAYHLRALLKEANLSHDEPAIDHILGKERSAFCKSL